MLRVLCFCIVWFSIGAHSDVEPSLCPALSRSYPANGVCAKSLCHNGTCRFVEYSPAKDANLTIYFRALLGFSSEECRKALVDVSCGLTYPTCKNGTLQYPCEQMCTRLNSSCTDTPALVPRSIENLISRIRQNFTKSPVCSLTQDCVNTTGADGSVSCPSPLGQPDQDGFDPIPEAPYCGMPCQSPVFNEKEYHVAETTLQALAWCSLVCTAVHLIERISSGQAWKYPQRMQLHFAFCLFILSIGLCMNTVVGGGFGEHPEWCKSAQSDLCLVQAVIVNYFALAVLLWWLAVCVHLYLAVVFYHDKHRALDSSPNLLPAGSSDSAADRIQRDTAQWETHFKVLAYSIPAVITLLLVVCGELGAGGTGQIFCWIKDDNEQWWQFAFFYFELGACFTVGFFLFGRVLHYIWTRDSERSLGKILGIMVEMRQGILFVVLFFMIFFWLLVYRILVKVQFDQFGDAYENWIQCTLTAWAESSFLGEDHQVAPCPNRDQPSYFMWISEIVCIAGMGVLEFIVLDLHHCIRRCRTWCCAVTSPACEEDPLLLEDDEAVLDHKLGPEGLSNLILPDRLAQSDSFTDADSPLGAHGLSNMTATMTTDSASSTPCPSPQIIAQDPQMRSAQGFRMSMVGKRPSLTFKHGSAGLASIHSKRELYALAMAPTYEPAMTEQGLAPEPAPAEYHDQRVNEAHCDEKQ